MSIQIGTRVVVRSPIAYGATGTVDQIDGSTLPYLMAFDTPRNGIECAWFKEGELEEIEEFPSNLLTTAEHRNQEDQEAARFYDLMAENQ